MYVFLYPRNLKSPFSMCFEIEKVSKVSNINVRVSSVRLRMVTATVEMRGNTEYGIREWKNVKNEE